MTAIRDDAKVTVVIPTYNRADLITTAIKSVINQTYLDWKLLIIDDASTDQTENVLSTYLHLDLPITYYRMQKNSGQAHALNQALQMVTTKYMIQLDSDDWLPRIALEKLVAGMEREPETTAMAYGNYTIWTKKGRVLQRVRRFSAEDKYKLICYGPTLCPRFFRTACLRAVGGWDTDDKFNGRYIEDRRIMYKLIGQYNFLWIPESLYNINRLVDSTKQLTHNVQACNEVKKQVITRTLQGWGNKYVPKFSYVRGGWLKTRLVATTKVASVKHRSLVHRSKGRKRMK